MSTGGTQRKRRARQIPTRPDAYERLQQKMIHETELGLTFGLRFPDQVPRIPTVEVGTGSFDPELVEHYWIDRLEIEPDGRVKKKRWWRII